MYVRCFGGCCGVLVCWLFVVGLVELLVLLLIDCCLYVVCAVGCLWLFGLVSGFMVLELSFVWCCWMVDLR